MAEWNWTDGGWGNKPLGRGQRQGRRSPEAKPFLLFMFARLLSALTYRSGHAWISSSALIAMRTLNGLRLTVEPTA
jgi:hypothetical protein